MEVEEQIISINREAFKDLVRVREELDTIVDSLELMQDEEFMESNKKAKMKNRGLSKNCFMSLL